MSLFGGVRTRWGCRVFWAEWWVDSWEFIFGIGLCAVSCLSDQSKCAIVKTNCLKGRGMKVRIEIDTRTFVRFWLVVIGFAAVILAIWVARGALITLGLALFLALALNPPVSRLVKLLPGNNRVGATALAYLLVVVLLGGFL